MELLRGLTGEHTVHWQVRLGRTGSFRDFWIPQRGRFSLQFLSGAFDETAHVRDFA